jgi:hypothetical protein
VVRRGAGQTRIRCRLRCPRCTSRRGGRCAGTGRADESHPRTGEAPPAGRAAATWVPPLGRGTSARPMH